MGQSSRPPTGPEREVPTPRWVYVVGIAVVVLALVFAAMHLGAAAHLGPGGIPHH